MFTVPSETRPRLMSVGSHMVLMAPVSENVRVAVTPEAMGFVVVPMSKVPVTLTTRVSTVRLVFLLAANCKVPSTRMVCSDAASTPSTVIARPIGTRTLALAPGTCPLFHVLGLDQEPLWTAVFVTVELGTRARAAFMSPIGTLIDDELKSSRDSNCSIDRRDSGSTDWAPRPGFAR